MNTVPKCGVDIDDVFLDGGKLGFLLVHRLGGTPLDMMYVAKGIAASGHTVACPLLYGHGGSRALLGATSWAQWYQSLIQAHDNLKARCDKIIVGGLGVGALLALNLAAERRQSVDGAVLFAPTLWPNGWAMPWRQYLLRWIVSKRLANQLRFDERPPYGIKDAALRAEMLETLLEGGRSRDDVLGRDGGAFLEVKWMSQAVLPKLDRVFQPSLIFHPRDDDRSLLAASQLLQRRLCGTVELIVLDDSYHLVTLDRQRDLVLHRVLEFAEAILHPEAPPQPPPTPWQADAPAK